MYRAMRLIRRFEERAIELVDSGELVGGIHPYIGQEAVAVGVCHALDPEDAVTSTHRGHGHVLAKGADPARMLAELLGRTTGLNHGRGGSMHAADLSLRILGANGIVGAGVPMAVGAAWAAQAHGTRPAAVATFFGDGALNQGVVLEAMNLAAVRKAPVIFVCENNGYATTLPAAFAVAGSARGRAEAFAIPVAEVDGMDVRAVRAAADEAVERARAGGGPTFLDCATYRFLGHHTAERGMEVAYRTEEEIERWRSRDPLPREAALLDPGLVAQTDTEIEAVMDAAVEFARSGPHPERSAALDYAYASGLKPRAGAL